MLNGAGPFKDPSKPPPSPPSALDPLRDSIVKAIKRIVLFFAFLYAKQPLRIKQVLGLVYSNKGQLDEGEWAAHHSRRIASVLLLIFALLQTSSPQSRCLLWIPTRPRCSIESTPLSPGLQSRCMLTT